MSEERLKILRMVAEGKITSETADRLLEILEDLEEEESPGPPQPAQAPPGADPEEPLRFDDPETPICKTFAVGPGGRLTLETDRGSIEIRTHDAGTLDLEVHPRIKSGFWVDADELLDRFELQCRQDGDDVRVSGALSGKNGSRLNLHYRITVPRRYNLDLHTAGGSIAVDDLDGEVKSRTAGGSLKFGHIRGPVVGETAGGSISLAGCNGPADVRTSGGSITLGDVDGQVSARTSGGSIRIARAAGSVTARTSGGSIHVEETGGAVDARTSGGSVHARLSRQPEGPSRLETAGGSITVALADDIGVAVDAKTGNGRVTTDFPVPGGGRTDKSALRADLNGGGPDLVLRTGGGGIHIRRNAFDGGQNQ